jgi:hypothetical protein
MHLNNLHFCGLSFRLLKPNAQKCRLFRRKITFLGHVISADGIAPDPKRPRNVIEFRSIVGLCSYYRAHVPRFAEVAQALHELTKKHAVFQWTDLLRQAF